MPGCKTSLLLKISTRILQVKQINADFNIRFICFGRLKLPLRFFGKPRDHHRTNEIAIDI